MGVLLDRYGSRRLLLVGLVLMTGGPAGLRLRDDVPGRGRSPGRVLGAGDAMIFVSVIRLVTVWFLVRQAPMVTQLTGQVGQVGAIVAAAPLAFALARARLDRAPSPSPRRSAWC